MAISKQVSLLLDVSTNSEGLDEIPAAILTMERAQIVRLLSLMDLVKGLKAMQSDLYCVQFWDGSVDLFDSSEFRTDDLDDVWANVDDGNATLASKPLIEKIYARMEAGRAVDGEGASISVDCQRLVVEDNAVRWTGYVKHTSITVDAGKVERDTLVDLLAKLDKREKRAR